MLNRLFAVLVVALVLGGCGPDRSWRYTLAPENGKAKIDMDGVTLVFEGVDFVDESGKDRVRATGSLTVNGGGTVRSTVTVQDLTFESSYASGVNTMAIGDYLFELRDSGSKLRIHAQEFDLSAGKPVIVIARDGSARIKGE